MTQASSAGEGRQVSDVVQADWTDGTGLTAVAHQLGRFPGGADDAVWRQSGAQDLLAVLVAVQLSAFLLLLNTQTETD